MEEFVIVSHLGKLLFLVNVQKIGKIEIVIVVTGKSLNIKRKRKKKHGRISDWYNIILANTIVYQELGQI
jgi:hypothetical protein